MQPICNACQSRKLSWRIAIDSIQSRNHHYSSGTRERTSAENEDVQTRRIQAHLTDCWATVGVKRFWCQLRSYVGHQEQYSLRRSLFVTCQIDGTVECAPFRANNGCVIREIWESEESINRVQSIYRAATALRSGNKALERQ